MRTNKHLRQQQTSPPVILWKSMRRLVCAMVLTLMSLPATSLHAEVINVDVQELQELVDSGMPVIDVRRPDEWSKTGVLKDSHLLTFFNKNGTYDVDGWLQKLHKVVAKGEPFVLICAVGGRTATISNFLDKKLGYEQVHNAKGGIRDWIKQGLEVTPHSN